MEQENPFDEATITEPTDEAFSNVNDSIRLSIGKSPL